jgi:hypothetical protein
LPSPLPSALPAHPVASRPGPPGRQRPEDRRRAAAMPSLRRQARHAICIISLGICLLTAVKGAELRIHPSASDRHRPWFTGANGTA